MLRQIFRRWMFSNNLNSIEQGTYHGRLESIKGKSLKTELRLDLNNNTISADFFLPSAEPPDDNSQDVYDCSMRANLLQRNGGLVVMNPLFIFDKQQNAQSGGHIELEVQPAQESKLKMTCLIPKTLPEEYTGDLTFVSAFFRVLNIEVDKLEEDYPWPPKFTTRDIPKCEQPKEIWEQNLSISIEDIFRRSGINAIVKLGDEKLSSKIGLHTNRPLEDGIIRWDDRELHEMMQTFYSRHQFNVRDWYAYLLIVNLYDGGIKIDKFGKPQIKESTLDGLMFDTTIDPLFNPNPRQGAAIFWEKFRSNEQWLTNKFFLHTIIHELGHVLNLPHCWEAEIGRASSISFMNYDSKFKPPGSDNYWRSLRYTFDPEELFHICHGFYNEVIPGGKFAFHQWTSSSVFRNILGLERTDLELTIKLSRPDSQKGSLVYGFTEPVIVEVTVKNNSSQEIEIENLSPAYHSLKISIRKPNRVIEEYKTPLCKCSDQKITLAPQAETSQTISLAVNSTGFTFDIPGQYDITATFPDSKNNTPVFSFLSITVKTPEPKEEEIAERLFNKDPSCSLFLYMKGGNHLEKAKQAFFDIATLPEYATYPIASHANLILGLNEVSGQKRIAKSSDQADPQRAIAYLKAASETKQLPPKLQDRLEGTIKLCSQPYGVQLSEIKPIN